MLKCLFYRMMLHLTRSFTVACCTRRFSFVKGIAYTVAGGKPTRTIGQHLGYTNLKHHPATGADSHEADCLDCRATAGHRKTPQGHPGSAGLPTPHRPPGGCCGQNPSRRGCVAGRKSDPTERMASHLSH